MSTKIFFSFSMGFISLFYQYGLNGFLRLILSTKVFEHQSWNYVHYEYFNPISSPFIVTDGFFLF